MSLAGFKKQINKANQVRTSWILALWLLVAQLLSEIHQFDFRFVSQFVSEKIGGAKGSRLDEEFVELERVSIG